MENSTLHQRTPMYLLGQVDAMISMSDQELPTYAVRFLEAYVQMYDLLELAAGELELHAETYSFKAVGPLEIRAFLRGENLEGSAGALNDA